MAIIPSEIVVKITFDVSPLQDIENMLTAIRDAIKAVEESPDDLVTCPSCYGRELPFDLMCIFCDGEGIVPRGQAIKIINERGQRA